MKSPSLSLVNDSKEAASLFIIIINIIIIIIIIVNDSKSKGGGFIIYHSFQYFHNGHVSYLKSYYPHTHTPKHTSMKCNVNMYFLLASLEINDPHYSVQTRHIITSKKGI